MHWAWYVICSSLQVTLISHLICVIVQFRKDICKTGAWLGGVDGKSEEYENNLGKMDEQFGDFWSVKKKTFGVYKQCL